MNTCSAPHCYRSLYNKKLQLCNLHYRRIRKFGELEPKLKIDRTPKIKILIGTGQSYCNRCKTIKDLDAFYKDINNLLGVAAKCKECCIKLEKERRKTNGAYRKNNHLQRNYKISLEEYNQLLLQQDNKCAICKQENTWGERNLPVDHDHKTNKVRGILCHNCNSMLGYARDNIEFLKEAINYLTKNMEEI